MVCGQLFGKGMERRRRACWRFSVRGPQRSLKQRGLATPCAAISTLLLGGCRTDSTFEFKADGRVRTQIVFEDDTDSMRTLKGNCEQLKNYIGPVGQFIVDGKMEDVTPSGGHLTCKITSNTPIEEQSSQLKAIPTLLRLSLQVRLKRIWRG